MKYKVSLEGFAYVEADSVEEAANKALNDDTMYLELSSTEIEEVDEFTVEV